MKKKIGAFGTGQFSLGTLVGGRPGTTIFQNPEGGGGGGSHTKTRPGRPPPPGCRYTSHAHSWRRRADSMKNQCVSSLALVYPMERWCSTCTTTSASLELFEGFSMCTPCPAPPCTALHPLHCTPGLLYHSQPQYLQAPWEHDDGRRPRL